MKKLIFLFTLTTIFLSKVTASHFAGADLSYRYVSGQTYEVTLNYYADCAGISPPSSVAVYANSISCGTSFSDILSLTSGPSVINDICPSQSSNSYCNGGSIYYGAEHYVFSALVTMPAQCNDWVFSYYECCRGNSANLVSPSSYDLFITTSMDNSSGVNNSSPIFTPLSAVNFCIGSDSKLNLGAYDIDGDLLVFSFDTARDGPYPGTTLTYNSPATAGFPIVGTSCSLNSINGELSFNSDGTDLSSVVVVRTDEYRNGNLISTSYRDVMLYFNACTNNPPIEVNNGIYNVNGGDSLGLHNLGVDPGTTLSFDFQIADTNTGNLLTMTSNVSTNFPGATLNFSGSNPVIGHFSWTPSAADLGSHALIITALDDACPVIANSNILYYINVNSTGLIYVHGDIYADANINCIRESSELGLSFIVKANNAYVLMADSGRFTVGVLPDTTYVIEPIIPSIYDDLYLLNGYCPPSYVVNFPASSNVNNYGYDFGFDIEPCALMTVDISSNRRRRCFRNNTMVQYCNNGLAPQDSVEIIVEFPEYVVFISSDHQYSINSDGNYVFNVGSVLPGTCGNISIVDSVACEDSITGLTQCTKATLTPANSCVEALDTTTTIWDKSSVMVEGRCIGDSIIRYVITNTGQLGNGDMDGTSEYRIYVDNQLSYTGIFQLQGGDSLVIEVPANGQTIRLEADQRPGHPGNSHPRETVEACGNGGQPIVFGMPGQVSSNDDDVLMEEHCLEIRDSYDPNDKRVQPSGVTTNHYINSNTTLEYFIRFQNTGSDTAFTVIIKDTLDPSLDISTFQRGVGSHPYTLTVSGEIQPVLIYTFNNIHLPDSTTDELNSQGFVKYKITTHDTVPQGTVISNSADIYFDFNAPITTNNAWVTLYDTVLIGSPINVTIVESQSQGVSLLYNEDIQVIPNPFEDRFSIILPLEFTNSQIRLFDVVGQQVDVQVSKGKSLEVDATNLDPGIYFLQVFDNKTGVVIGRQKLVKN